MLCDLYIHARREDAGFYKKAEPRPSSQLGSGSGGVAGLGLEVLGLISS